MTDVVESNSQPTTSVSGAVGAGTLRGVSVSGLSHAGLGQAITGIFGSLILNADGRFIYTLDNLDRDTDTLATTQAASEHFSYTVQEDGVDVIKDLTFRIVGVSDPDQMLTVLPDVVSYSNANTIARNTLLDVQKETGIRLNASGIWGTTPTLVLTNEGDIRTSLATERTASAILLDGSIFNNAAQFVNNGLVSASNSNPAYGAESYAVIKGGARTPAEGASVINNGVIQSIMTGSQGRAVGALATIDNRNLVDVESSGDAIGVWVTELFAHIRNSGTVYVRGGSYNLSGSIGIFGGQSAGYQILNSGIIDVESSDPALKSVGINLFADSTDHRAYAIIENSGTIRADVAITSGASYETYFKILNSGTIDGSLDLASNENVVTNAGRWTGDFNLGIDNDTVGNSGSIDGAVRLGGGGDVYRGLGSGYATKGVLGGDGNDILIGDSAGDVFAGGAGTDYIFGGGEMDFLTGGADADIFGYGATSDSIATARDRILDFESGVDRIDLRQTGIQSVSLSVSGGSTFISASGGAGAPALSIEVLGTLQQSDILTAAAGGYGPGGAGSDLLIGSAAADALDGGGAPDLLIGGAGDDAYYFDYDVNGITDRAVEFPGEGLDIVRSSAGFTSLSDNIENLEMQPGAVYGVGNDGDNVIVGNADGNYIYGRGGNDTMIGGEGGDIYYVDSSKDIVIEVADFNRDTINTTVSYTLPDYVENLQMLFFEYSFMTSFSTSEIDPINGTGNALSNFMHGNRGSNILISLVGDDSVYGNDGNDTLDGGDGYDKLFGEGGNDLINGGVGNDHLVGGFGADVLYGGDGDDLLTALPPSVLDPISREYRDYPDSEHVAEFLDGGAGEDFVVGGIGGDQIYGGDGIDQLYGGKGNDHMIGGFGDDTIFGEADADVLFGEYGTDLIIGGTGDDIGYGQDGNDTLFGEGGNDELNGGAGNDSLLGQAGADRLFGEDGADALAGGADVDLLAGGFGDDILNGEDANDTLFGEIGNDTLVGGAGADTLLGQDGNDVLFGETGDDQLAGGGGDDRLYGQEESDTLQGEAGTDLLDGGAGNDFLAGGRGADQLTGGAGSDYFYFDSRIEEADYVVDFTAADGDKFVIHKNAFSLASGFALAESASLLSGAGAHPVAQGPTFYFDMTTRALWYDADGNDAGTANVIAFLLNTPTLNMGDFLFI